VSDFFEMVDESGDGNTAPHETMIWRPLKTDRDGIVARFGTAGELHFRRGGWGTREYLRAAIREAMPATAEQCWRFAAEKATNRRGEFLDALEQQVKDMLVTNCVFLMTCRVDDKLVLWWLLFADANPGDQREHGKITILS
jgi:hypothetical protein